MRANYGYTDASGAYYLTVDGDRCDGCGLCVEACPQGVLELAVDDYDQTVVQVKEAAVRSLAYLCSICNPACPDPQLKYLCHSACPQGALAHSW